MAPKSTIAKKQTVKKVYHSSSYTASTPPGSRQRGNEQQPKKFEVRIPVYGFGSKWGPQGEATQGMYNDVVGTKELRHQLYNAMEPTILLGQKSTKHTWDANKKQYSIPTISPEQSEMQWAAYVESEGGSVDVPKPDFLSTFNPRALDRLQVDIVPTPDPDLYVVTKGQLYPVKEKLAPFVSETKEENVGGSTFDGYVVKKENLDAAVEIMVYWGYKPTVYDEVA